MSFSFHRGMDRNRRSDALPSALVILLLAAATLVAAPPEERLVRFGNPRSYAVEHRGVMTNGQIDLSSVELWVPVPQDLPEQTVTDVTITPAVPVVVDTTGQAAVAKLVVTDGLPREGESIELKVTYRITCRARTTAPHALLNYPYREYPRDKQYEMFLRPEKHLEVGDNKIQELAEKFAGSRRPAPQIARDILDFIVDRTEYRPIDGFGGAKYCLDNRHGECGDYAALFVTLCRAAGVPARPVNGFWADKTNEWHCWAEFMLPTGEWVPVDPQFADQSAWNRRFYFGSLDNRRVALCKTHDVRLPESNDGHHDVDFLQDGRWWWWTNREFQGRRLPEAKFEVRGRRLR